MKPAIGVFTKAIAAARGDSEAESRPAAEPAAPPADEGFDRIRIPLPAGGIRELTRAEYEALPLPERVALLMGGKMQFLRGGKLVSAREALRGR